MISSGINLQKLGVAATLFAQSFTFGGVIEEVPPFGAQVIVAAPQHRERPPESLLHSTFLADEVFRSAAGVDIFSQGQSLQQPQSFTLQPLIEEVVEEIQIQSIIVDAESITQPESLFHGTFLADNVELDIQRQLIVQAARHIEVPPASFTWPSEDIEDVRLDIDRSVIVDAPRHAENPPESFLHGTFLADDVELDIRRQLIVEVEPIAAAVSITRGFVVPEIVAPGDLPEGLKVLIEAEQPRLIPSVTQGTFLADEVFRSAAGTDVFSQGQSLEQPQSFTSPSLIEDVAVEEPLFQSIIVQAEPLTPAISVVHPSITPPLETTARQVSITIEKPLDQALQATLIPSLLLEDIQLDIIRRVIVAAEPIADAISITRTSVIIADVVPVVIIARPHTLKFSSDSQTTDFESDSQTTNFSSQSASFIMECVGEPTEVGFVLLEDGGFLLLEDGGKVKLENV